MEFLRFSSRMSSATPSPILSMLNGELIPQLVRLLSTNMEIVKPLLHLTWSMLLSVPAALFTVSVPKLIDVQLLVSSSSMSAHFIF